MVCGVGWVINEKEMNGRGAIALFLVAFAPLIFAGLTFSTSADQPVLVDMARFFGLPIVAIELIVIILALGSRVQVLQPLRKAERWQQIALATVILIAVGTALFVAPVKFPAVIRTAEWLIHPFFGLAVMGLSRRLPKDVEPIRIWQMVCAGLLAYTAGLAVFVALLPNPESFNWVAFWFGVVNIRQIGTYSGAGFVVALSLAILAPGRRAQVAWTAAAAILIALSFWSGTRNSIAAVVGAIGVGVCLLPVMRRPLTLGLSIVACAGGFVLAHIHMPPVTGFQVTRFYETPPPTTAPQTDFSSGRTEMWKKSAMLVFERPFFGHGESQFRTHPVARQFNVFHPHNSFIQVAFQWGLVGALCFFALFTSVWVSVLRVARRSPDIGLPAFMLINVLFAISLLEGSYYYPWPLMISAFSAAFAVGAARNQSVRPTLT